jgi:hypothetical protein
LLADQGDRYRGLNFLLHVNPLEINMLNFASYRVSCNFSNDRHSTLTASNFQSNRGRSACSSQADSEFVFFRL